MFYFLPYFFPLSRGWSRCERVGQDYHVFLSRLLFIRDGVVVRLVGECFLQTFKGCSRFASSIWGPLHGYENVIFEEVNLFGRSHWRHCQCLVLEQIVYWLNYITFFSSHSRFTQFLRRLWTFIICNRDIDQRSVILWGWCSRMYFFNAGIISIEQSVSYIINWY